MKTRKFYPRQVLRALVGDHEKMSASQKQVLWYFARRGRKLGISIMAGPVMTKIDYETATQGGSGAVEAAQHAAPYRVRVFGGVGGFPPLTAEAMVAAN